MASEILVPDSQLQPVPHLHCVPGSRALRLIYGASFRASAPACVAGCCRHNDRRSGVRLTRRAVFAPLAPNACRIATAQHCDGASSAVLQVGNKGYSARRQVISGSVSRWGYVCRVPSSGSCLQLIQRATSRASWPRTDGTCPDRNTRSSRSSLVAWVWTLYYATGRFTGCSPASRRNRLSAGRFGTTSLRAAFPAGQGSTRPTSRTSIPARSCATPASGPAS